MSKAAVNSLQITRCSSNDATLLQGKLEAVEVMQVNKAVPAARCRAQASELAIGFYTKALLFVCTTLAVHILMHEKPCV